MVQQQLHSWLAWPAKVKTNYFDVLKNKYPQNKKDLINENVRAWGSSVGTTSAGLVLLSTGTCDCWALVEGWASDVSGTWLGTACRSWGRTSCTLVLPAATSSATSVSSFGTTRPLACCCCQAPSPLLDDELSTAFIGRSSAMGVPSRETGVTDAACKRILCSFNITDNHKIKYPNWQKLLFFHNLAVSIKNYLGHRDSLFNKFINTTIRWVDFTTKQRQYFEINFTVLNFIVSFIFLLQYDVPRYCKSPL